jgi:hypothetical protein
MSLKAKGHKDFAKQALEEFTDGSFGKFVSETEIEKGIFDVRFEATSRGYHGWHWVVTITQPDKRKGASISEINLLAGPDALLAPPWVPWSERLKEFRQQLRSEGKAKTDAEADELISQMSGSNNKEGNSSKNAADDGGMEPPKKVRVRKRLIKRTQDQSDENPDPSADGEN